MTTRSTHGVIVELNAVTHETLSNSAGFQLYTILHKNFEAGNTVQLSLEKCEGMTSSFLNSSFGELVSEYGLDYIKEHLTLIHYKKSIAVSIKNYLEDIASFKHQ